MQRECVRDQGRHSTWQGGQRTGRGRSLFWRGRLHLQPPDSHHSVTVGGGAILLGTARYSKRSISLATAQPQAAPVTCPGTTSFNHFACKSSSTTITFASSSSISIGKRARLVALREVSDCRNRIGILRQAMGAPRCEKAKEVEKRSRRANGTKKGERICF